MKPYYEADGITIYHGDCRDLTVDADALITDPPYGVNHDTDYHFTGGAAPGNSFDRIAGDDEPFDPAPWANYRTTVLWGANNFSDRLTPGTWLVWDKRSPGGSKNVMSDAEVAWMNRGHGVYVFDHCWDGFNRASERNTAYHPTQKPVALMRWVLDRATKPGDLVFDPFMGSGPIARACADMGRRYVGCELVEGYCAAAVNRLAQGVLDLAS